MSANENTADLFGLDLPAECARLRTLNAKLTKGVAIAAIAGFVGIVAGAFGLLTRPSPERIALDAAGRAIPLVALTKADPPDARITRVAADCMNGMFNHAFHNYQTTVERTIGDCFTGGGSASIRNVIEPFLARLKAEQVNMAGTFVIQPFINSRSVMGGGSGARNVFHVQGVIAIGYRGAKATDTTRPVEYAFQTDIVRVSYDSHIEGIRLQNVVLGPWEK